MSFIEEELVLLRANAYLIRLRDFVDAPWSWLGINTINLLIQAKHFDCLVLNILNWFHVLLLYNLELTIHLHAEVVCSA